ncbi:hypothetical protein BJ944DRAFT_155459 [Cunninghamella echinulata]|nr:hypothetical protein BJ944DRAFT_155459 [Cunninghamella echinulata]
MDAISFVLGVHSSHLRSHSIKDMIYRSVALDNNSSTTQESQSEPDSAYVLAIYQKDNGEEIKFMRIAYRNGQSEYRLNGRQVPYLKYNAALEEEHILVKAKNFLVFQGDVESVASQSPSELTKLIEQISGSWDLKVEYEEFKSQYEHAVDNNSHALNKKRGITVEVKQYKQQIEEAERFTNLTRERQEMMARYLLWKLYHVERKISDLEVESGDKRIAANDATGDQETLEDKFKSTRKDQALIHRERTRKELQIKKVKREIAEQRPNSIAVQEKLEHLEKKIDQIKQNGIRAERDLEQQKTEVAELENSLELLNGEEARYNEEITATSISSGFTLTPDQIAQYEQLKQQVSIRAGKEQEQLQNLQRKRKLITQEMDRQKSKLNQFRTSEINYKNERQEVMDTGNALTEDGKKLSKKLELRQQELKQLEMERKEIHQREVIINEQLQVVLNELMEAKSEQRESDKDQQFKESLSMMKQIFPGVHGQLSKLCKPTQRKYGHAITTVLGRNLDAIIVDDQKTAIDCIQYLREQRIGTAVFLPLDSISTPTINDRYRSLPRANLAVDIIQCDHIYLPAIQYACGNTIVCDNIQAAKRICYGMNEDVKAVTLDGAIIHRSGLITGGPTSAQSTRQWDEKDVDGLLRTRDKLLAELNELSRNKRMGSAEELAQSDCDGMKSRLTVLQDEIKIAEQKLKDIDSSLQNIQENVLLHQQQLSHGQSTIQNMDNEIKKVENVLAAVENEIFATFCEQTGITNIQEYEAQQFVLPEKVRERKAEFNTQRSRLQTQLSFGKQQIQDIQDRIVKLTQLLHDSEQEQQQYQNEIVSRGELKEKLESDLQKYESELVQQIQLEENKQKELDEIRVSLEEKGRNVEGYLKEMAKLESNIEKIRAERVAIFRKCKLEDIRLPLLNGSMDDVLVEDVPSNTSSVESSSSMDIDDYSQRSIRSTDWVVELDYSVLDDEERNDDSSTFEKRYQDDIKRRNDEIEQMAPNLKAVDRLEGVEQRLHEIEDEYRTARQAAEAAKSKFEAVKQRRNELFKNAFNHISEQIDQIYKELTKTQTFPLGGTAYLTLEDTEEPYLKGIMYHAMPPMKRFRDMEQLSGGEKSMAALALLFAIRSYHASPFFVLDEVDAALDNTNVKKVVDYIRSHASDNFQFIVISFKNILYERAQSLVGVYRDRDFNSSKSLTLKVMYIKQ